MAAARSYLEKGRSARLIEGGSEQGAGLHVWLVGITRLYCFQMQRIGAELRVSATVGEEPEVEVALA